MVEAFNTLKRYLLHYRHNQFVARISHDEVLDYVHEEGRVSARYMFMVIMSCGIAMLGLLLSSPAVVIGAMLISPLMGPIMSLGFSLCVLDWQQLKRSLKGIVTGIIMAIAISWAIVALSPLNEATSEIMARTKPNLFDLLVAVFSGLAGGYAVIRRKGGAIVGVAIATALMPPLAVVGYGIAVHNAAIYQGAFFLFMTNLLAIAFCVTLLAKWYGFGGYSRAKHTLWQTFMILGVFALLSLPLGLSLRQIAYEVYVTKAIRGVVEQYIDDREAKLNNFSISFNHSDINIISDAVIFTRKYMPMAESDIKSAMEKEINEPVKFRLDQVVLASKDDFDKKIAELSSATSGNAISAPIKATESSNSESSYIDRQTNIKERIERLLISPVRVIDIDEKNKNISILFAADKNTSISMLNDIEQRIIGAYPGWNIEVIPPFGSLPNIYFKVGSFELDDKGKQQFKLALWALKRWQIENAEVVGFASTIGGEIRNGNLALKRAEYISSLMKESGINSVAIAEYSSYNQKNNELKLGTDSFQKVEIRALGHLQNQKPQEKQEQEE